MKPEMTLTIRDADGSPVDLDALRATVADYAATQASISVSYSFAKGEVSWIRRESGYASEVLHEPLRLVDSAMKQYTVHIPGGSLTVTKYGMQFEWSAPVMLGREAKP